MHETLSPPRSVGSGPLFCTSSCFLYPSSQCFPKVPTADGFYRLLGIWLSAALIEERSKWGKWAKEVHTCRCADEVERKGTWSAALLVPFLATWAVNCQLGTVYSLHERTGESSGAVVAFLLLGVGGGVLSIDLHSIQEKYGSIGGVVIFVRWRGLETYRNLLPASSGFLPPPSHK